MKKIGLYLTTLLTIFAMTFTSCDNGTNNGTEEDVESDVKFLYGIYYGNLFSHYTNMERMIFGSEGTSYENAYKGTGTIYLVDLCADMQDGYFPKAGDYRTADAYLGKTFMMSMIDNGTVVPSEMLGQNLLGCYKITIENDSIVDVKQARTANLKISGNAQKGTIVASFVMEILDDKNNVVGTEDASFTCQDAFTFKDNAIDGNVAFEQEEQSVTTENFTIKEMKGLNNGDVYECGLVQYSIELQGDKKEICQFILYAPKGEKPIGTYTVTHRTAGYTAERSIGADNEGIYPPFIGVVESMSGQEATLSKLWFLDSGTITIENEKISFEIKTHNGSTIKGVYDGIVTFTDGGGRAPQQAITKVIKR